MNSSKTNEILKDVKTKSDQIYIGITECKAILSTNDSTLSTINGQLSGINSELDDILSMDTNINSNLSTMSGQDSTRNTTLSTIANNTSTTASNVSTNSTLISTSLTKLTDINTELDNIQSELVDIGITLTELNKSNKMWFKQRLDYDGTDYIGYTDYSSSAITGYYENSSNQKQYITEFNFAYEENSDPDVSGDTYHSPKFTTKIGKMNNSNVFETPYMTIQDNRDQGINMTKMSGFNPNAFNWKHDFSEAPIELGVTERFGHYINGNFTNTYYDSWCVGNVIGYYYK